MRPALFNATEKLWNRPPDTFQMKKQMEIEL